MAATRAKKPRSAKPWLDLRIERLTTDLWPALVDLFGERGACNGCWCMYWRIGSVYRRRPRDLNRKEFEQIVRTGPPPGLLAFHGELPVGWCQITPRDHLPWMDCTWRLRRVDDVPVWSISCFYVRIGYRRSGVTRALIEAALAAAREANAPAVEAYPLDGRLSPSSRSTGYATTFGRKDMRAIGAGDIQRFVAAAAQEGLDPKTIRNHWGTVSLIWSAALAQKCVDALLPKPKLPRRAKKRAKFFTLFQVARIIAASEGEHRIFYWLAAETGLRSGELAGLKLNDIDGERMTVSRSVWLGKEQTPKTNNALRTLALSPQLITLLWEQIARQKAKGSEFLFSASTGQPLDMNVFRRRKMTALLTSLSIQQAGFHAFRHFNVAILDALRVPLKTIQERLGHALTGSFTLDVYGGTPEWGRNLEAARAVGAELEKAVAEAESKSRDEGAVGLNCALTALNEKGLGAGIS